MAHTSGPFIQAEVKGQVLFDQFLELIRLRWVGHEIGKVLYRAVNVKLPHSFIARPPRPTIQQTMGGHLGHYLRRAASQRWRSGPRASLACPDRLILKP